MTEPVREGAQEAPVHWPRDLDADYECLGEIGRGGMAVVFRARERELGRDVAIKVVRPRFAADQEAPARLMREAKVVAQLQHPNVVGLYAIRKLPDQSVALVMQLVPGRTLKAVLREEGPLDPVRAEQVLLDVTRALAYAHRAGVVHRDVKPENIFLDDVSGRALLSDFGIARAMDSPSELTATGTTIGTPTYMAPEQIDGGPLDGRSDLYSLGMVAWEMLTGEQPWAGENLYTVIYRQKHDFLPPVDTYRDDVPLRLQYLVEGLLHKNPDRRWNGAARLLNLMSGDEAPPGMREWQSAQRRRRRSGGQPTVRPRAISTPEMLVAQTMKFVRGVPTPVSVESPTSPAPPTPATGIPAAGTPATGTPAVELAEESEAPPPGGATPGSGLYIPTTPTPGPRVLMVPRRQSRATVWIALAACLVIAAGLWAWTRPRTATPAPLPVAAATPLEDRASVELPVVSSAGSTLPPSDSAVVAGTAQRTAAGSLARDPAAASLTPRPEDVPRPAPTRDTERPLPNVASGGASTGAPSAPAVAPPAGTTAPTAPSAAPSRAGAGASAAAAGEPLAPVAPRLSFPAVRRAIAAGGRHSCAIGENDRVECWGSNERGQIGDGGFASRASATAIVGDFAFIQVAAGGSHSCGVTRDGGLLCWGNNGAGQLGDGTTSVRAAPVRVNSGESFISVTAGLSHTCGSTRSGRVLCWGANDYGQLGDGTRQGRSSPVAVALPGPAAVVAAGWNHTCAIVTDGTAHCWGRNDGGQLGDGNAADRTAPALVATELPMVAIAGGSSHTCGITTGGAALCWGRNNYGQVGEGASSVQTAPHLVALNVPVSSVTTGSVHTCALSRDGSAWCWGRNSNGQLGDGTAIDRSRPVPVRSLSQVTTLVAGGSHTCARLSNGESWCWGYNVDGQVGRGDRDNALVPARVGPASR